MAKTVTRRKQSFKPVDSPPGGLLSICWYTCMCLPFGVYFHEIRYIDGWVSVTDPISTQFSLNWVFFCRKWYNGKMVQKLCFFRYSEWWSFGVRQAHPRTKFGRDLPPPGKSSALSRSYNHIDTPSHCKPSLNLWGAIPLTTLIIEPSDKLLDFFDLLTIQDEISVNASLISITIILVVFAIEKVLLLASHLQQVH